MGNWTEEISNTVKDSNPLATDVTKLLLFSRAARQSLFRNNDRITHAVAKLMKLYDPRLDFILR